MMMLSIDPGLNHVGWALWEDGRLLAAGLARAPSDTKKLPLMKRVRVVTNATVDAVKAVGGGASPDVVLVEVPQSYRLGKSKGDPNDLISVALVASAVAGAYPLATWEGVKPREWKSNINGDVMAARIEKSLTPDERAAILECPASLRHNILDAIGLGRWWWGRMGRVYLGGGVPCE